jgi:hypothetical protein
MYGLPRQASAEQKLAILLRHLGIDPDALSEAARTDIVQALRVDQVSRSRPAAFAEQAPLLERDLRNAAYVIGHVLDPSRIARFVDEPTLRAHMRATRPWLMAAMSRHGLAWPESEAASAA